MSELHLPPEDIVQEGLRYDHFTTLIGELAIGDKVRLTPLDEIIDKAEIRPIVSALEDGFTEKVRALYNKDDWRFSTTNREMSDEGYIEDWLIGRFAGKLSNLELTRLPDEDADVRQFFRKVMKRNVPQGRSLCRRTFTNYALSVEKKSTGRSAHTSIAQIGYHISGFNTPYGPSIRAGLRVVDDRSRADFANAVHTARMLESVQVINTLNGGAASPQ